MAGAGYKLFQTGDVLTAAQVNTYLNEQTVMVFADAAARTTALTSVLAEGMVSYLQDTNAVEVYNGSAWVGVSGAGDVTEVQAGTGISVASGTGPIPVVTNTMATAVDAKGDLIVGTGADTFARLAVGTNGHTLVADSSVSPTGLKWAVDPVADVVTTAGDLLYGTAADTVARLGIGTASQVLAVNSGATAPEWVTPAAGGLTFVGVAVKKTATQGTNNTTFTLLTWNSEDYDTDGFHDNSVNNQRITIPAGKGGKYLVSGIIGWEPNATGVRIVNLRKNGSSVTYVVALPAGPVSDFTTLPFSYVIEVVATDYLELNVYQSSGGALNVQTESRFQVSYLGA